MEIDPLDEIVARIPLGDPAGQSIPLSGRVLCQNVLTTGMVGSGKTTSVIYPLLKDLIAYRAGEQTRKLGLFVFDSKCDGTTERVEAWAKQCGRKDDVVVLRPGSSWGFCPIKAEGLLSQMEVAAAKLLAGFRNIGEDNEYWMQTMRTGLEAALALDMLDHGVLEFNRTLATLSQILLNSAGDATAGRRIEAFTTKCGAALPHIDRNCARIIDGYCRALKNWIHLDPKTRGILQSCVSNALRPLLSPRMLDYYPLEGRIPFDAERIVTEGKILVLRTNASADEDLAATLGRLIKADLYRALQNRSIAPGAEDRLVGLIFDEYPLVATANEPFFGDVQNLQTLREKRGFIVAGTQGYISMNNSIGARAWEGLRINFGSCFFLKSNEPEVEMHARNILGRKETESSVRVRVEGSDSSEGGVTTSSESKRKVSIKGESHIIGEGAMARLEAHEGYYMISDGETSETPVFLLPVFETAKSSGLAPATNLLDFSAAIFRHSSASSDEMPGSNMLGGRSMLPATCSGNTSGTPLPLPLGSGSFLNVPLFFQEFGAVMTSRRTNAKPTIKEKVYGLQDRTFAELLPLVGKESNMARLVVETVRRAGEGMLAFSEAFEKLSGERKVSRAKLATQAQALYEALGVTGVADERDAVAGIVNRDSKLICATATDLDLRGIPEECFSRDTVSFFSVLKDPFYEGVLPRLILVAAHEGLPLAVFDPGEVTRENAILVAAAMVSFANCFGPKRNLPSLS